VSGSVHDDAWRRLGERFEQALAVPAAARPAWLLQHCPDAAERAEVEALLAAFTDSGSFLEQPLFAPLVGADIGDVAPPAPARVADWELLHRLGAGGSGTVHAARHVETGERVAIKLVRGSGDAAVAGRLQREARALAKLDHPQIARLRASGSTADGVHWFALELVDGEPLDRWVARALPSRELRVRAFLQLCAAVEHAHVHGVLHRDLKPANVLIAAGATPDDVRVKVVDFGLARLADDVASSLHTLPGSVIGTLPYMSPEQALADAGAVGVRSDVYALGAMWCELLTGRLPVDVHGLPLPAALRRIAEQPPLRPGDVDPSLRGDCDTVVLQALAKDPAERYASVAAFGGDVARWAAGTPVVARRPGAWRRARRVVRRHRAATAAAAVVFVCALATIGATSIAWWTAAAAEQRAVAERDVARRAEAILTETLAAADPTRGRPTDSLADAVARAAERVFTLDASDPAVAIRLHAVLGSILAGHARYAAARAHFERALALVAARGEASPRLQLELADVHFQVDELERAAELQHAALAAFVANGTAVEVANAQARLAGTLRRQGDTAAAERLYRDALATPATAATWVATTRSNLAGLLAATGRLDEALVLHEQAIAAFTASLGSDHTMTALARGNLAALQVRAGALTAARAQFSSAITTLAGRLGPEHAELATLHHGLGIVLAGLGEPAAGALELRQALAARRTSLPPEHPHLVSTLVSLARAEHQRGDAAAAVELSREALALDAAHRGGDAELLARRELALAEQLADVATAEARAEAVEHFTAVLRAAGEGPDGRSLRHVAHCGRGTVRLVMGDRDGAERDFVRALVDANSPAQRLPVLGALVENLASQHAEAAAWRDELRTLRATPRRDS
jgi:eukaryotic-like serine/threonine-protein kinase